MTEKASTVATGGCLCGAVRYEITGQLRNVVVCHCTMCVNLHGGPGPHSKALKSDISLLEDRGLRWYRTSDIARRGFCGECGASLFWEPDNQEGTGILAGSLDQPTGLKTMGHIFVGEKPDFVEITDQLPQFETSSDGALDGDHR